MVLVDPDLLDCVVTGLYPLVTLQAQSFLAGQGPVRTGLPVRDFPVSSPVCSGVSIPLVSIIIILFPSNVCVPPHVASHKGFYNQKSK